MPESLPCSFVCPLLLLNILVDSASGGLAATLLVLTSYKVLCFIVSQVLAQTLFFRQAGCYSLTEGR